MTDGGGLGIFETEGATEPCLAELVLEDDFLCFLG